MKKISLVLIFIGIILFILSSIKILPFNNIYLNFDNIGLLFLILGVFFFLAHLIKTKNIKALSWISLGILLVVLYVVNPLTIKRICFGDVCPDNGGVFLLYKKNYSKEECLARRAHPVEGIGWGPVYAGCSPINNELSR